MEDGAREEELHDLRDRVALCGHQDRACVEVCPVDCIDEGGRALDIHPVVCVDCGACEPGCPVEAIYCGDDMPEKSVLHAEDTARFFSESLFGRDAPLGSPCGAVKIGAVTATHAGRRAATTGERSRR
jgi:NAD-dependent dihydropyrimidine dehydrogenase PreA subunit